MIGATSRAEGGATSRASGSSERSHIDNVRAQVHQKKQQVARELLQKYMCGFLNSVGGKIVFGVDDKSSAIEMVPLVRARADETAEQLQVLANAAKVKTLAPLVVS